MLGDFCKKDISPHAFSLIGLMGICSLLVIAFVCAFPGGRYLQHTHAEQVAVQRLKLMASALEFAHIEQEMTAYPDDLTILNEFAAFERLHAVIASGQRSFSAEGYRFIYTPRDHGDSDDLGYDVYAYPLPENRVACRAFVLNEGGTVYLDTGLVTGRTDRKDTPLL